MRVEKQKKIDRKTGKEVGIRWKFWEYDSNRKRNRAVPMAQIPQHIRESQDSAVVDDYVRSQNALTDSKRYRAQQRLEWKSRYADFGKLLDRFTKYHKDKAKNSWQTDCYYLETYVFHFFLNVRSFNNLYDWKYHFEDFKEWLREIKPLKVKKDRLAKNTQNKCIKALNRFMAWAYQTNVLTELQPKCEVYAREELPQIGAEDLYTKEEQKMLIEALRVIRPISADFFMFLNNSGCRLNEGLGVCPPFVVEGQIDGDHSKRIHDKLKVYGMDRYYGYIVLMNQPELDSVRLKGNKDFKSSVTGKVWEAEQVPRKPLKHRKNDRPEDWRYIPIYDKATWNMLVDRWNEQDALLQKKARGRNPNDYLLFDGLTASMFYVDLMKAVAQVKLRFRSPHKCRHTYLSWFYAETDEDPFLAKKVGGHKDQGSRAIYSHISQQIGLEQKFVIQMTKKMRRVD